MARKKIKKFSVAPLDRATGSVSDTENVEDKVTNAPSIGLTQRLVGIPTDGVIAFDGDEIPDGYEEVEDPLQAGTGIKIVDNLISVAPEVMIAKSHVSSVTDYNQLTENGIYRINKITTNAPSKISDWGGFVIVFNPFKDNGGTLVQLAVQGDGTSVDIRTCWYGTWIDWRKLF